MNTVIAISILTFINGIILGMSIFICRMYLHRVKDLSLRHQKDAEILLDLIKKITEDFKHAITDVNTQGLERLKAAVAEAQKELLKLSKSVADDIIKAGDDSLHKIISGLSSEAEKKKKQIVSSNIRDIIRMHNILSGKDPSMPSLSNILGDKSKEKKFVDYCEKIPKVIKNETDYFYAKEVKQVIAEIISKFEDKKFDECNAKEKSLRSAYEKVQHVISKYEMKNNK